MVHVFNQKKGIIQHYLAEIRDQEIQKDPLRFRRNMERVGEVMAIEIASHLEYKKGITVTPLGEAENETLAQQPVLATILRAGLPLHAGMLHIFDRAENAFVSAYRKHHKDNSFEIQIEYLSSPSLDGKTVILTDPMLATGSSMVLAYQALLTRGTPAHVHIASVIASKQGLEYVKSHLPMDKVTIWLAAVDEELTAHAYIVPGLGDAGDLAYGVKI